MLERVPVLGFDRYEINRLGEVYNRRTGKQIKAFTHTCGYTYVSLNGGTSKVQRLHKFVALAFIPNPHGYRELNHIDGVKANNKVSNLEWCTRSYNMKHAVAMGLHRGRHKAVLNER